MKSDLKIDPETHSGTPEGGRAEQIAWVMRKNKLAQNRKEHFGPKLGPRNEPKRSKKQTPKRQRKCGRVKTEKRKKKAPKRGPKMIPNLSILQNTPFLSFLRDVLNEILTFEA